MTKKTDISVPQGYFDHLQERLQAIPDQPQRVTLVQRVSPWIAYAASLAVLVAMGNFIFRKAAATPEQDTGWDYIAYLSQSLDPDGLIELIQPTELSEEDIVSFLLAENVSVEQLENLDYEESY